MRQRYWIFLTSILFVALLGCVILIFDSAISLTYSRSHSESLTRRCLLLAQLAKPTLLVGYDEAAVSNLVGPDTLVKTDDEGELSIEDIIFRTAGGRITGIDGPESCR